LEEDEPWLSVSLPVEVTTELGHAGVLGDAPWIDFREPASSWLAAAEAAGGLMSVNHPFAGPTSWVHPMPRRPPLLEVWHWSWLDLSWTTSLSWWQAWDPAAIPVGGSDWHRPGSDAPLGTPTTWVLCADDSVAGVLAGLRSGRVAISASRDGAVLLRDADCLVAVGADGLVLAGPAGPVKRIAGDLVLTTVDRNELCRVQTPQGFRTSTLRAAYAAAPELVATDDAGLVEAYGAKVRTVPGDEAAFKITTPYDLRLAELLVSSR